MSDLRVLLIADGFFDDLLISIESILRNSPSPITVLVNGKQPVGPLANFQNDRVQISEIKQALGWGNAINFLLEASSEKYVVLMDPSTTFTGDAITPVLTRFSEGWSGIGWRGGLVNVGDDWRSIDDKGDGEVDALFSYFFAFDRQFVINIGGTNPSAKYYRNADIELSLAMRENGGRLLQLDLPLKQGHHHGYHDVNPSYREKNSKKNYQRILERFRGKDEILSPRR